MHMNTGTVVSSLIVAATAGRLGSSSGLSGILDVLLLPVDIILFIKVRNGNRTRIFCLEGRYSTIELHRHIKFGGVTLPLLYPVCH